MASAAILTFGDDALFGHNRCVLHQIRNIPTKIDEEWSNGEKMATVFRNSRCRQPPSWLWLLCYFWHIICVVHRIRNIPIKFGEDWSNIEELTATVFLNWRWRQPSSWILVKVLLCDMTYAFYIAIAIFPLYLVRIDQIVKKWQRFFELQDGGSRHLDFWSLCIFPTQVRSTSNSQHPHQIWWELVK